MGLSSVALNLLLLGTFAPLHSLAQSSSLAPIPEPAYMGNLSFLRSLIKLGALLLVANEMQMELPTFLQSLIYMFLAAPSPDLSHTKMLVASKHPVRLAMSLVLSSMC